MSDAAGAQAISAVSRGVVVELPNARTFAVPSSSGEGHYLVTLAVLHGALHAHCTCEAGRHDRRCWHARAAAMMMRRTTRPRRTDLGPDGEPPVGDLEPDRL